MFDAAFNTFPFLAAAAILEVGGFNHSSFTKFKNGIRERKQRESVIPDEDLIEVILQIIRLPFLGGRKGALKLLNEKRALIGETLYTEIKKQLEELCEQAYFNRKTAQLEKDMKERASRDRFEKVVVSEPHEVWSIDYTCIDLLGLRFSLCVVYEIYSQAYLAITPGTSADIELAQKAIHEACAFAGTTPKEYLLSDNGCQFLSDDFNEVLRQAQINERKTPPGQPWYNGSLESGNRDLKRTAFTVGTYLACDDKSITKKGITEDRVFSFLEKCCAKVFKLINNALPRTKFGVTPMDVIENRIDEVLKERAEYVEVKIDERKQKREAQKLNPKAVVKTIEQRISFEWNKLEKKLTDDKLFAFRELIHGRYNAIKT